MEALAHLFQFQERFLVVSLQIWILIEHSLYQGWEHMVPLALQPAHFVERRVTDLKFEQGWVFRNNISRVGISWWKTLLCYALKMQWTKALRLNIQCKNCSPWNPSPDDKLVSKILIKILLWQELVASLYSEGPLWQQPVCKLNILENERGKYLNRKIIKDSISIYL